MRPLPLPPMAHARASSWTTARGVSVVGVTAITEDRRSYVIGLEALEGSHTADALRGALVIYALGRKRGVGGEAGLCSVWGG
jgi:hypothetical protein